MKQMQFYPDIQQYCIFAPINVFVYLCRGFASKLTFFSHVDASTVQDSAVFLNYYCHLVLNIYVKFAPKRI